jgi:NAD-dependent dihydropyrimidine dehydrogenase PreA subunit
MFAWLIRRLVVAPTYVANYGYTDGSGDYYLIVDTDKCDGCGKCVEACPQGVLEVEADDYDDLVVFVKEEHRKNLKYVCAACKPVSGPRDLKCQTACPTGAISHSW